MQSPTRYPSPGDSSEIAYLHFTVKLIGDPSSQNEKNLSTFISNNSKNATSNATAKPSTAGGGDVVPAEEKQEVARVPLDATFDYLFERLHPMWRVLKDKKGTYYVAEGLQGAHSLADSFAQPTQQPIELEAYVSLPTSVLLRISPSPTGSLIQLSSPTTDTCEMHRILADAANAVVSKQAGLLPRRADLQTVLIGDNIEGALSNTHREIFHKEVSHILHSLKPSSPTEKGDAGEDDEDQDSKQEEKEKEPPILTFNGVAVPWNSTIKDLLVKAKTTKGKYTAGEHSMHCIVVSPPPTTLQLLEDAIWLNFHHVGEAIGGESRLQKAEALTKRYSRPVHDFDPGLLRPIYLVQKQLLGWWAHDGMAFHPMSKGEPMIECLVKAMGANKKRRMQVAAKGRGGSHLEGKKWLSYAASLAHERHPSTVAALSGALVLQILSKVHPVARTLAQIARVVVLVLGILGGFHFRKSMHDRIPALTQGTAVSMVMDGAVTLMVLVLVLMFPQLSVFATALLWLLTYVGLVVHSLVCEHQPDF